VAAADERGIDVDAGIWCQLFSVDLDRFVLIVYIRSDVVDDDRDAQAMFAAEDVLEKRSLSGALRFISYSSNFKYLQCSILLLARKPDKRVTGKV